MPVNRDAMTASYEDVRADDSDTMWATYTYSDESGGKMVEPKATGTDYASFLAELTEDSRCYCYVRIETGDDLSKRGKFALITWIGGNISVMKRAKMSTDKADVKVALRSFAVEFLADDLSEVAYETVKAQVVAVGGANYGDGTRAK